VLWGTLCPLHATVKKFHLTLQTVKAVTRDWEKWYPKRLPAPCRAVIIKQQGLPEGYKKYHSHYKILGREHT
jgi:hypothetical protein